LNKHKIHTAEIQKLPYLSPLINFKKNSSMGVGGLVFWTAAFIVVMVIFIELKERY
jgi:hypothetical protein